jgi:uncharacterized protein YciI/uncharacterized protein YndB with AHSA1/START domain
MTEATITPVRREVRVGCDPATAFELFTAHISAWWPMARHSVFGAPASVAFEDGRLVERLGSEAAVWGTVLDWDRPRGFRITWHPGHGPERATEVAVSFAADGAGTTVTLVHTGWERLAEPQAARDEYNSGWPGVLAGFAQTSAGTTDEVAEGEEAGAEGGVASEWFALHHRPGPALGNGGSVFAHPLFGEHVAFLGRLRDREWLVAAGPVVPEDGEGMTVVRVPAGRGDELTALAREDDQSVTGGLLTVSIQPWDVRFTGE